MNEFGAKSDLDFYKDLELRMEIEAATTAKPSH
jgi:hypothetical protein